MKHIVIAHRHYVIESNRPGCMHGAFALAFVALVILGGYVADLIGFGAYAVNVFMLLSVVYALGFVVFVECKRWIDSQVSRWYSYG